MGPCNTLWLMCSMSGLGGHVGGLVGAVAGKAVELSFSLGRDDEFT